MYEDRKETQNIISLLTLTENYFDVIDHYYPNWIVSQHDNYSSDYFFMNANWQSICDMIHVNKQKIILVQDIFFDDNHKDMMTVCEFLTKKGYCVRRKSEFVVCRCGKLIVDRDLWSVIKKRGNVPVPEEWSDKCTNC